MSDLIERLINDLEWSSGDPNLEKAAKARLRNALEAKDKRIAELEGAVTAVTGWREYDWPEGFDRRTAELIADHVRDKLEANNG